MAWSTPKTWVDNVDVLSASNLNTHIRDEFKALTEWTTYTPTWTATGGTPTVGNGSLSGSYILAGDLLTLRIQLTIGSTTSLGTTTVWRFSLPSGVTGSGFNVTAGSAYDSSANTTQMVGGFVTAGAGTVGVNSHAGVNVGYLVPFTWATGDVLTIQGAIAC